MHRRLLFTLALVPLVLTGCGREPTSSVPTPPVVTGPVGLVAVTISGIGTPQQSASARAVAAVPPGTEVSPSTTTLTGRTATADAGRLALLPTDGTHDGTIQLVRASSGSFTYGNPGAGGYRYVYATFQVRNATMAGVAYTTARTNLTFLGVNAAGSLSGTAIKTLNKFDGTPITTGLETQVQPTGWAQLSNGQTITTTAPDILQEYTEAEVAAAPRPSGVTSIEAYGFVVRNPNSTGSRTLAADPGASQFDGLLTLAYKVPLQANPADDPYTITGLFLAVDDNERWVTQSVEDSDATSVSALAARARALGASLRALCTVRIGGTAAAPTGFIGDSIGVTSVGPNPFAAPDSLIDSTASLEATFTQALTGASAATFVVNSFQGGRAFLGGSYGGAGTATLKTPNAHFWPGDVVEVALTGSLHGANPRARVCPRFVYRYRVKAKASNLAFGQAVGSPVTVGSAPASAALGDLNGDGKLDLVTANSGASSVSVLLGTGTGGFSAAGSYSVGSGPQSVALGDLNGDGKLDAVTANSGGNSVTVLLGNGGGGFATAGAFSVGPYPLSVALGDVNGDGRLDAVTANANDNTATVLLGNGAGGLTATGAFGVGGAPHSVALGDVNGDGKLDLVASEYAAAAVRVLLGNGLGDFTTAGVFGVGSNPSSVALGDLNGDGKLDILTANTGVNTATVLLGDGAGGFTAAAGSPVSVGSGPFGVALGDVSGDGKLDLVTANSSGNSVTLGFGNGAGAFTTGIPGGSPYVGAGPRSVALGDVNGDGKLDLVTANFDANTVTVLLGSPPYNVAAYVGNNRPGLVGYRVNVRPAVHVEDPALNPVAGAVVTFAVTGGGGSGTGLVATTDANGVAQVGSWTLGTSPGVNTMTATVTGSGIFNNPLTFSDTGLAATFSIVIQNYGPALSAPVQNALNAAAARWQTVVYRHTSAVSLNYPAGTCGTGTPAISTTVQDLLILVKFDSIDGPGGTLGQAGPCLYRTATGLTVVGTMVFDTADVATMISGGILNGVMLHEMAHVLGFGTLWNVAPHSCLQLQSSPPGTIRDTYFSCADARAAFDSLGGGSYTGGNVVPVENCGPGSLSPCGAGTVNSHWRYAAFGSELMIGWAIPGAPLSLATVAAMEDIGYTVAYAAADPYSHIFTAPPAGGAARVPMGDDIRHGPIYAVDEAGRVVRVIQR
jgi:hypothetical protein